MQTREQWLEERKTYLGASEMAAVLGLSRYSTPLKVWAEKCSQIPQEPETLPQWLGRELEPIVSKKFMEETGKTVYPDPKLYRHPKYDFLGAHIDRQIKGEPDAVLEIKTAHALKKSEWTNDIPTEYLIQSYAIMACTGKKLVYLAALIGNTTFLIKEIKRNETVINSIVIKAVDFWNNNVLSGDMPYMTQYDSDILYQLFPVPREDEVIDLDDSANLLCEEIESMSQDVFALDAVIKRKKNELRAMLKDYEVGSTGRWRITWKLIEKAAHQVVASKYRQLRISKLKQEGDNDQNKSTE